MRSGSLNVMTGQYSFGELRAGAYQLQVGSLASLLPALPPALAAVLQDFEYGGPGEGYAVSVAAGQAATQNIPVDITHTTITVGVTLKGGDYRGMPVPGASVELYADEDGETKVGSGMTAENGGTMIRIARMGTSDNTVHMSVSTDDYFMAPDAGMQAVTWNPQSTVHPMPGADSAGGAQRRRHPQPERRRERQRRHRHDRLRWWRCARRLGDLRCYR